MRAVQTRQCPQYMTKSATIKAQRGLERRSWSSPWLAGLLFLAIACFPMWGWATPDAGSTDPDTPQTTPTKRQPATGKPTPRQTPPTPGVWRKIKDGMGELVPGPVKRGWETTRRKWEQAQAMYEAMKKFAGWDDETLRRKRIAAAKQELVERWQRADEAAEKLVIQKVRLTLWRHACHGGSARACRKWRETAPKEIQPLIRLRDILARRKQWKKLLPLCAQLQQLAPKTYGHQLCLARATEGLKQSDKALVHYQRLTQRFPLRGVPWLALGQLQLAAKRPADAAKACATAVARMPLDTDALFCLGKAEAQSKQRKAARATFAKACELGHIPSCQEVRDLRPKGIMGAWVWSKMNTRINALRVGRATQDNSCYVGVQRACRGIALEHQQRATQLLLYARPFEAEWLLRKAVRIAPFDSSSWRALGQFLHHQQRSLEACGAIQRSLRIDTRQPKLWMLMAQCRERSAESVIREAKRAYRRACALGHNRACMKVQFHTTPTPTRP